MVMICVWGNVAIRGRGWFGTWLEQRVGVSVE